MATENLLVIATDVVQSPNDKQQSAGMLEEVDALAEMAGPKRHRPTTAIECDGVNGGEH